MPKPHLRFPRQAPARGFTLVELLTVIAIIGVLAGLLIPAIGMVQHKVRVVRTQTLFGKLEEAFVDYRNTYNTYPVFTEINPATYPWPNKPGEVDTNFLLNEDAGLLYKVLTADPSYYTAGVTATNHNPQRAKFLTLDDNSVSRNDPGTINNPVIVDGFNNAQIGVMVHTGNEKGIRPEGFVRGVNDQFGNGPLIPPVKRNLDQIFAFYSLVTSVNSDPINSEWVVNWDFDEVSK